MNKLFPLIILDTHTTGLLTIKKGEISVPKIIELSAVAFSPESSVTTTEVFQTYIRYEEDLEWEEGALKQNGNLYQSILDGSVESVSLEEAVKEFKKWSEMVARVYDKTEGLIMAGRKVESFDLPVLKYSGFDLSDYSHKTFDVESLFYREDLNKVPTIYDFNKILKLGHSDSSAMGTCELMADILRNIKRIRSLEKEE